MITITKASMQRLIIITLCIISFGLGIRISDYYYSQCLEATQEYVRIERARINEQVAESANNLIKNRHKEFVTKKWKFRASPYGLSVEF